MAKKRKTAFFIVPLDVWNCDIMVSVGQTNDEIIKSLPENIKPELKPLIIESIEEERGTDATTIKYRHGEIMIRIKEYPKNAYDYGLVCHEIFHAIEMMLRHKGMQLTDESSEAYAYAIGYLSTHIFRKLWK